MNPLDIQKAIQQNRQSMSEYAQKIPQLMSQNTAGDQEVQGLQSNKNAKILELYNHDKMLADQYANPNSNLYLQDPYARERARATQNQATAGEVLDIGSQIQTRKDYLKQQADQQLQLLEMALKEKQMEQDSLQNELSNAIRYQEANKDTSGSADLLNLFNALSTLQKNRQSLQASAPIASGVARDKGELQALARQHPGEDFHYTPNNDGTYQWSVAGPQTQFLTQNQANTLASSGTGPLTNQDDVVQQLLAATIARNPKMANEATILASALLPKTDAFGFSEKEVASGVAGLPRTPENTAKYQAYLTKPNPTVVASLPWWAGGGKQIIDKVTGVATPVQGSGPLGFLSGLLGSPGGAANASEHISKLRDPKTGKVFSYSGGESDPDYQTDLRLGFVPTQ